MGKNLVEIVMGAMVLAVAALFIVFAYTTANVRPVQGYELTAKFERVDGLSTGSDIKLAGVKVGTVIEQRLDPQTFEAVLRLSIDPAIKLPADTEASIASDGLLGGVFISLTPGREPQTIPPGGEITRTIAPINLTRMLGDIIFGSVQNTSREPAEAAPAATPRP